MTAVLDISTPQQALVSKPSLAGLGRAGLKTALASIGVPDKQLNMRVGQLWSWIYARGATSFEAMSNVSKDVRGQLQAAFTLERLQGLKQSLLLVLCLRPRWSGARLLAQLYIAGPTNLMVSSLRDS